ncbi:enoyl-CoA hydratase/isomerase family protein [Pleionea litopenaei]|uniref:Enoyl-CoA hydratase/isomerase family protein n=1 Tax=Pleionea litopenaei TaxID=3070815 RepID=A0AA51RSV5_9GAMM|nr:enoyl-CoA hydratase/isomerase family protein [Pleionea sp. HL-JVS1]WMS87048.1 enoyl-CoA hydratase/isomerase family protein [Pleionea sp. HL-JVS1]
MTADLQKSKSTSYITSSLDSNVLTLTMNRPKKLNGWTLPMIESLVGAFAEASKDDRVKAVILTGADPYYCAGVDLGGSLKLMHPKKLHQSIKALNERLFNLFIEFDKPILIAVNGPAIGASVTSATLCNGIIASENATFSTPFACLGVPPEGCSSIHLPRLIGSDNAKRMLGEEGWKPSAEEALNIGLIQWLEPHVSLLSKAQTIAKGWVKIGSSRDYLANATRDELKSINAKESVAVADAMLSAAFLKEQARFFWRKNKKIPSLLFWSLWALRPIWGRLL